MASHSLYIARNEEKELAGDEGDERG
jgi:hypothetical protein